MSVIVLNAPIPWPLLCKTEYTHHIFTFVPGLSTWLVERLIYLRDLPVWVINLIISMLTTTVTEVVSNTATANILLPILKEMSLTLCQNPTYLGKFMSNYVPNYVIMRQKWSKSYSYFMLGFKMQFRNFGLFKY